jgi:hypothetical protein
MLGLLASKIRCKRQASIDKLSYLKERLFSFSRLQVELHERCSAQNAMQVLRHFRTAFTEVEMA